MCCDTFSGMFDMFWFWTLTYDWASNQTHFCSLWTSTWPYLITFRPISDDVFNCMFDNVFGILDPTSRPPMSLFWNEYSSISVIYVNVLFVFPPSLGSLRKKALGFENILSPWCSSFAICITMCRTSFPYGWAQSSCVHWQQLCFLSTYDLTLRW